MRGVHLHQMPVSITGEFNRVVLIVLKRKITNCAEEFYEFLVSLCDCVAQI